MNRLNASAYCQEIGGKRLEESCNIRMLVVVYFGSCRLNPELNRKDFISKCFLVAALFAKHIPICKTASFCCGEGSSSLANIEGTVGLYYFLVDFFWQVRFVIDLAPSY